ncbi:MAG: hypothetical protein ACJ716_13680 [Marmoricola sp.]
MGTETPVIVTPADGASYAPNRTPDFVIDFSNAPYGTYDWSVKNGDQLLHGGTVVYEAGDASTKDVQTLTDIEGGFITATVTGPTGTVTSTFDAGVVVDPGPYACVIDVPEQVRVVSPMTAVYARFYHCAGWTLNWAIRHQVGSKAVKYGTLGVKDGRSIGPWRYRDSWPTGRYLVQPPAITGPNSTQMSVKFGSRVTLAASAKTASHFKLSGDVSRYVASIDGWHGWADHAVAISYKNCVSGCQWRYLRTTRTDAIGHFALSSTSSLVRYWRATVADTSSVWGSKSASIMR